MPWGSGIPFGARWGALNQPHAQHLATQPTTGPLYLRLHFAALGWANVVGHAEFPSGHLAQLVRRADGTAPSAQQLGNAIARAVSRGLLDEQSSSRCLVPSPHLWDRAGGTGTRSCRWHGIPSRPTRHDPAA